MDSCHDSWANEAGIDTAAFLDWKNNIIENIDRCFLSLDSSKRKARYHSIFKSSSSSPCLSHLQFEHKMVPIDNTANEIAFI